MPKENMEKGIGAIKTPGSGETADAGIDGFLRDVALPLVARVEQRFSSEAISDAGRELMDALRAKTPVKRGMKIAISCGSRGIDRYPELVRTIVEFIKSRGGFPFLVPAMGSHGGATDQGQIEILERLGISENTVGAPVISSMETAEIGRTDTGLPVYADKNALQADAIILLNRVKPHTSFRGSYESGIVKMLAIGLAKHKGAEAAHLSGFDNMAANIEAVGKVAIERLNILAAVATVENGYGKIAKISALGKEEILAEEPKLLKQAWDLMPRIYLDEIDVLIVGEIGKDISGTGMDTNIVGRFHTKAASGGPVTKKLGILDLSPKSDGNANGMGNADFVTKRLLDKIDFNDTYINTLTSTEPNSSRLPMVLATDKRLIQACAKLCGQTRAEDTRLVLIKNTKNLDIIYMSEAAFKRAPAGASIKRVSDYAPLPFDGNDQLPLNAMFD